MITITPYEYLLMVPKAGLEPARVAPLPPQAAIMDIRDKQG